MERGIRVFLVAGNRLVRDALTRVITRKGDIQVVGSHAFSPDLCEVLFASDYDVLLIDWGSAGPALLEMLSELRERHPARRCILLGVRDEPIGFLKAVKAGVRGILLEDASASDVATAIRTVAQGHAVCPPSLCTYLFEQVFRQAEALPSARIREQLGLSRREQQLIPYIARGMTNKEIAHRLGLSEQTVKNHIHKMLQKAGVNDRLEVVEACADQPLPEGPMAPPAWP
ncbi:MAG: LuxR C-terminal-related transcriptional regulator [Candidatus Acidiferrales bacterium]